ncbi:hypothetical protein [Streptomyces sp. NPDC059850]|uniref:hypothetical protein n=1 Tax=Streptomyces sp. NPDC059850 TaxID=3346970 RepID=UPI00364ACD84
MAALEQEGGRLTGVRLASGILVACQALAVAPRFTARAGFLAGLGLSVMEQVVGAAAAGARAAGAINAELVAGDTRLEWPTGRLPSSSRRK